jgi:hypothetical protein
MACWSTSDPGLTFYEVYKLTSNCHRYVVRDAYPSVSYTCFGGFEAWLTCLTLRSHQAGTQVQDVQNECPS